MTTAERTRYATVAVILHWLIAGLLLTNIGLAWYFNTLHGPRVAAPLALHKSVGITVLLLSLARLGWRLFNPAPKLPAYVRGWERLLAQSVHVAFYVLMIGLPLTGWATVSASVLIHTHPTVLYGVIPWPAIGLLAALPPDQMHDAHKLAFASHQWLVKIAYAAIALHVLGALKHQFISRDDVVSRMVPFLRQRMGAAS
jgi:cytochrome b561